MSFPRQCSLADLLILGVPVGWPEAVALAGEIADCLERGALAGVPALHDITLDAEGTVGVGSALGTSDPPVEALARLFDTLLAGANPPAELRQLVTAVLAEPPAYQTVGELRQALVFFERPGRQTLLAELFARGAEAYAGAEMNRELERLRAQQREADQPATPTRAASPRRRSLTVVVLAGALALVVGGAAGAWLYWPVGPAARASGGASAADDAGQPGLIGRTASRLAAAVESLVSPETGQPATPDTTPGPDADLPADASASTPRRTPEGTAGVAPVPTVEASAPSAEIPSAPAEPVPETSLVPDDAETEAPDRDVLFDATSIGVTPPFFERQQLPSRVTAGDPPAAGVLELVVNEDGTVDKVRLMSHGNRHEDRMIVAAAKAWRFTPAQKDGQPVRYRLLVPLTW